MKLLDSEAISRIRTNFDKMRADRQPTSYIREEISQFTGGNEHSFITDQSTMKDRTDEDNQFKKKKVYSSAFSSASQMAASGIHSALFNGRFHGILIKSLKIGDITITDPNDLTLRKKQEELTDALFEYRNRLDAGFQSAMFTVVKDVVDYGNGAVYIDWITDRARGITDKGYVGLKYLPIPIEQLFFTLNAYDFPDKVYRTYYLSVRSIFELAASSSTQNVTDNKQLQDLMGSDPDKLLRVIHAVELNTEYKPDGPEKAINKGFKKYAEYNILPEYDVTISATGHDVMPYAIASGVRRAGKTYGEGLAYQALPTAKTLNMMEENNLLFVDQALNPIFITHGADDSDVILTPGSLHPGLMNEDGTPLIQRLPQGDNQIALQSIDRLVNQIEKVFAIDALFPLTRKSERMTVAEVTGRMQERGMAIGPIAQSLQDNFLSHVLNIELYHLLEQLKKNKSTEEYQVSVYFTAPFNQDMKAAKLSAMINAVQTLALVANSTQSPDTMDVLDTDEIGRQVALASDTIEIFRDAKEIAQIRASRAAARERQATIENASGLAALASAQAKLTSAASPEGIVNTPGQPQGPVSF